MSRMRHSTPLQLLGLLSSLWLVLAGCGGQSGSDGSGGGGGSAPQVRHITLQLVRSIEGVSPTRNQGIASAQVRQIQPGEPGFIQRLEIRLQTPQGVDLLAPQEFALGPAEQETVALDVLIPDPPPAELQILVSAFNNFNNRQTVIFLGQVLIQRGQESATLTLVRNPDPTTLIPVPAVPATLQETVFPFTNGAVFGFGLGGAPVTLTTGSFQGNTGTFTLAAGGLTSGGQVTIGSCDFVVTVSTFPPGQGPQVGDRITFDPCAVDAIDGRLSATNASLGISAISEAPVAALPTSAVILPFPLPTLVIDEDTGGTVQISAAITGPRPGGITSDLTESPAHGTAVLDPTGLLTYQPAADFNGSDRLEVTVTVTFTDGNLPPFLLGTVPIAITVQPINDPPSLTSPGNQTALEGATVSLPLSASDVDGGALTFSATGLPPGLSINATTGLISGTVAPGAAAGSPYSVTVTVSDGVASASASFTWTVPFPPPTLSTIAPSSGPASGGTAVTLTGTGFQTGATVTIGGTAATTVSVVSATQITATTSAGTAGAQAVVVTNPDGQSAILAGGFTYIAPPPTLSAIAPTQGPTSGGTPVTLTGTNFQTGATVTIGGTAAAVSGVAATQITATTPAGTAGPAAVVVTNPDGQSATLAGGFMYNAAPTLSAITPSSGPASGSTAVTLTGSGFQPGVPGTTVTIGGAAASAVNVGSATQITATTPAGTAGPAAVVVTNPDGQSATLAGGFTYNAAPTLSAITPSSGPASGGTAVTLTGTNFQTGATVTIGGTAATTVSVVSATQITATTPAGTAGAQAVVVTNPDGQSATLAAGFTYIAPPTLSTIAPSSGPASGGTVVTLTGTGFQTGATVMIGCAAATNVSVASATQITATTPAGPAGPADVVVTNPDGQHVTLTGGFTYIAPPTLSTITPNKGPSKGGTPVTLTGTNFQVGAKVAIGGTAATTVSVVSATQITATTPAGTAGPADVVVTNPDGQQAILASGFTYTSAFILDTSKLDDDTQLLQ